MCGLAGYVDYSANPERKTVSLMTDAVHYRGPDSAGLYLDKTAALGIRRLSIIDLVTGEQPIYNEDKSLVIVFNGEIYNYRELRENLLNKGHRFKTKSDTEVIIHLYEEFGRDTPKHLNGMFAFAIWDKKNSTLFMARDHAGIKPLYYWHISHQLVFGSEIKALLKHPDYHKEIDPISFNYYASLGYIPGGRSFFKGINKLPGGHCLTFNQKGLRVQRYWSLMENKFPANNNLDSLLSDTVKRQLIADVPVGLFLSGGLDSSLLAYYATKHKGNLQTFSIAFKDQGFDESGLAKITARQFSTRHHEETFMAKDLVKLFPKMTSLLDEPLADPTIFPTYKICRLARKHVTVALSGEGGDELFGGYHSYKNTLAIRLGQYLPKQLHQQILKISNVFPIPSRYYQHSPAITRFFQGIQLPLVLRHIFWTLGIDGASWEKTKTELVKESFYQEIVSEIERHNFWTPSQKLQWIDVQTLLQDYLLVKADRASMYNSLELRVPYLDPRIMAYCFQQPRDHVDRNTTKKIMRRLAKDKISPEIVTKPKQGFTIPLSKWLREDLSPFVQEQLENKNLDYFFDRKNLESRVNKHKNRIENHSRYIWMVVMFSGWLKNWY